MDKQEQLNLLKRVLDKDSTLSYDPFVIEVMKESKSSNYLKRVHKIENPLEYIDPKKITINPNASGMMRGLWKSLGLESDVLTPTKEESFSTPVLKELVKTTSEITLYQRLLYKCKYAKQGHYSCLKEYNVYHYLQNNKTNIKEIIQQVLDISSTKNLLSQYIPAYEMNYNGKGGVYQSARFPGTLS